MSDIQRSNERELLAPLIQPDQATIDLSFVKTCNPKMLYLKTFVICFLSAVDLLSYTIIQPVRCISTY